MVYLISINYQWLLCVDQAFCESYTCVAERSVDAYKIKQLASNAMQVLYASRVFIIDCRIVETDFQLIYHIHAGSVAYLNIESTLIQW